MCFNKKPKPQKMAVLSQPEKAAEPQEVGDARKAEDEALFGEDGVPQLRVDRAATGGGTTASGTGLRMM